MAAPESSDSEPTWQISTVLRRELLSALLRAPIEKPHMSYEAFLDWLDEDTLAE